MKALTVKHETDTNNTQTQKTCLRFCLYLFIDIYLFIFILLNFSGIDIMIDVP